MSRTKRPSKYWENRFEILQESLLKKGGIEILRLEKEYRLSVMRLEKEITRWYTRLAENNNISLYAAKKLLSDNELQEFQWTLEEYIKYGRENALNQKWVKELENASAKVHISKLEEMQIHIRQQIELLTAQRETSLNSVLSDIYQEGYYRTLYELQKEFSIQPFDKLDNHSIGGILSRPWNGGKTFSQRIWADRERLTERLETGLIQEVVRGDSMESLINSIKKEFDVNRYCAERLVLTESAYFASLSQLNGYKEMGVEKYKIIATLDLKTSNICRHMDGMVLDVKYYRPGVSAPPFHPWCRSCTAPYFGEDKGTRIARNENGKSYYIPADMTYWEWKKKYVGTGLSAGSGTSGNRVKHKPPVKLGTVDFSDTDMILSKLKKYENIIGSSAVENAIVVTKNGDIMQCFGDLNGVYPNDDLGSNLIGAYVTHNHPAGSANEFSFSKNDINLFMDNDLEVLRGIDDKFIYELTRNSKEIDEHVSILDWDEYSTRHEEVISMAEKLKIGYRRYSRE